MSGGAGQGCPAHPSNKIWQFNKAVQGQDKWEEGGIEILCAVKHSLEMKPVKDKGESDNDARKNMAFTC